MKQMIFLTLLSLSSAFATEVKVDDAFCGEIDPFLVGDACIVQVTAPAKSKIGLVFSDYDLEEKMGAAVESLVGKTIEVNFDLAKTIKDQEVIRELKNMGEKYFYMYAPIGSIEF